MAHRPIAGRLVIATHNPGKLAEMRELLAVYGVDAISAGELKLPEPEETGTTFRANARIKAEAAAKASNMPAFADDSGLAVDALDGQPGIHSARWAGPDKDFGHAMERVHSAMAEGSPDTAYFTCALSLAWPDGAVETFEGRIDGRLVWPPRGENGFGYDAMFVADGMVATFGEIDPDHKHAISHRARAFEQLVAACFL